MGSDLSMNPPREKPKYCSTCRFWGTKTPTMEWTRIPPQMKEDFEDDNKRVFLSKKAANIEAEYGLCLAIKPLSVHAISRAPGAVSPKGIFTLRSFGCNMWQPKPGESEYY